jgi:hypothetical protein
MGECLAADGPAAADDYVERAMYISEDVGARNDLARAMMTRAALHQKAGDLASARQPLDQAGAIFEHLALWTSPLGSNQRTLRWTAVPKSRCSHRTGAVYAIPIGEGPGQQIYTHGPALQPGEWNDYEIQVAADTFMFG